MKNIRAWHKKYGMSQVFNLLEFNERGFEFNFKDGIQYQKSDAEFYSDLKEIIFMYSLETEDFSEKEIFEGDIVKFSSEQNVFIEIGHDNVKDGVLSDTLFSEVCFANGIYYFNGQYGYEGREINFKDVVVVGNKYENPELISRLFRKI